MFNINENRFSNMSPKEAAKYAYGANAFPKEFIDLWDIRSGSSADESKVNDAVRKLKADGYEVIKKRYSEFTGWCGAKRKGEVKNESRRMKLADIINESGNHRYELSYTRDNIAGALKGNDPKKLISQIQNMRGVSEWSLFRNGSGFHGYHQDEFLISWWSKGGGTYWDNRGAREPEVMKKKYKDGVKKESIKLSSMVPGNEVDEARKVTDAVVAAFMDGKSKRVGNTHTDGKALYLHNNKIAEKRNGELWISNAGWFSATTKERLNGIPGVSVMQKAGKWYLNGQPWDGEWTAVGDNAGLGESITEAVRERFVENLRRLENVGHNKGHQTLERTNEIVMINEGGKPIYLRLIDQNHFFMSDNLESVQRGNAKSYHVRAIENKLYAKDISGWLSGEKSAEQVYGNKYKYKQG